MGNEIITFVTDKYIIDPLGIAYLSAMLKEAGYAPKLMLTSQVLKGNVIDTPIVGYSVTTGKHKHYAQINRFIKTQRPDIISLFGGPHPTFFPDFAREKGVDYICRGEGFGAIVDFVKAAIEDKALGKFRKDDVKNIGFYDYDIGFYDYDNDIVQNELRPQVNVSELPFPDREIIYQFPRNKQNPIRNVMASFGCFMSCSYCYAKRHRGLGYAWRIRSVESTIEECAQLIAEYPTKLIFFQDDIFPIMRGDWIESFCREYKKRIGVPFHVQIRIEMLTEDVLKQLAEAGVSGVTFAIETANLKVRREILNRDVSDASILSGAKLLHQYNIRFRTENMLGLPGSTIKDAMDTLDLNIQCRPDCGWASLYTPYPGTDLGGKCCEADLIEGFWAQDFFTESILKLKDKKKAERLQKLFGLICAFPKLRPLAPFLISMPFGYRWIYEKVKQWLYTHRLYKVK